MGGAKLKWVSRERRVQEPENKAVQEPENKASFIQDKIKTKTRSKKCCVIKNTNSELKCSSGQDIHYFAKSAFAGEIAKMIHKKSYKFMGHLLTLCNGSTLKTNKIMDFI
ncbi:hypothetical protein ACJX0J_015706, partial [Zea mays]